MFKNKAARWFKPDDAFSAAERLAKPFFSPYLGEPKFKFDREEKFFMIGSCFARGLELALAANGLTVLSVTRDFDHWAVVGATATGATNKYNLPSIRHELSWALGEPFPNEALCDLHNGTFSDPHMTAVFAPAPLEEVLQKRAVMTRVAKGVFDASVVIITLGLVEVWKDATTDLVLNSTPHPRAGHLEPNRFVFGRLNYAENLALLGEIYALLKQNCSRDLRIILTVSPIPLQATFFERDVVEATLYSKSVLRVVAEDFAASRPDVAYFPSYEIVMNSHRDVSWHDDCRHVRGALGNHVMSNFFLHYMPRSLANEKTLVGDDIQLA